VGWKELVRVHRFAICASNDVVAIDGDGYVMGWKDEQPEDELPGKIHVTLIQNLIVRTVAF